MDWMYMYMPIAGVTIFWPGMVLIGFSVGVIGGFFGMGGAWMVTPGLNILGFPMAFAIGTDMAHMAGKSMISTFRHAKFGNVDYKLGLIMVVGTVAGIEVGAQLVMWLEFIGQVGPVVRWVYVVVLALIALTVFTDYLKAVQKKKAGIVGERGAEGHTWVQNPSQDQDSSDGPFQDGRYHLFHVVAHHGELPYGHPHRVPRNRRRPDPHARARVPRGLSYSHRSRHRPL